MKKLLFLLSIGFTLLTTAHNQQGALAITFPFYTENPLRPLQVETRNDDLIFFRPVTSAKYQIYIQTMLSGSYYSLYSLSMTMAAGRDYPIKFQLNQYFFKDSRIIRIVVNENGRVHPFYYFNIGFVDGKTINPANLTDKMYQATGFLTALVHNSGPQYLYERIFFDGYNSFHTQNIYYQVDLALFNFTYNREAAIIIDSPVRLGIYDPNNLFPKFSHGIDKYFYINLKMQYEPIGHRFYYAFAEALYVEPTTLIMAPYQETGFEPINRLLFPLNTFLKGQQITIRLEVNPLGINQIHVLYQAALRSIHPFYSRNSLSMYYLETNIESVPEWGVIMSEMPTDG